MDAATELKEIHGYSPEKLLDLIIENLRLKNDAGLSRMFEISAATISKIRHRKLPVSGALLIRMHEVTGLNIKDLRFAMGDRRIKFRGVRDAQMVGFGG